MKISLIIPIVFLIFTHSFITWSQETGAGIGIYPTGTETGIGFRSSRTSKIAIDFRMTRANFFLKPQTGSFINELSLIYRISYYEKIRFHIGIGARADWNLDPLVQSRFGAVMPIGVEAFPFPFQNAGLFFEAAPFFTSPGTTNFNAGIRTVAGIAFYFIRSNVSPDSKTNP